MRYMHESVCKRSISAYIVVFLCLSPFTCFPENTAKARIALVKGHGLVMVHSLQSRAEETLSSMEKWLEAHYLADMKRYGTVQCGFMYGMIWCRLRVHIQIFIFISNNLK